MQGLLAPHAAFVPLGQRRGNPPASAIALRGTRLPVVSSPTPRTKPLMFLLVLKLVIAPTVPSWSMHPSWRNGLFPCPGAQLPGGLGGQGFAQQAVVPGAWLP